MIEIDPAVHLLVALGAALLFTSAAVHKLRDPLRFAEALAAYDILPAALVASVGRVLPFVELVCAVGLMIDASRYWSAICAIGLLALYGTAIAVNLWRGRTDIDCGCSGPAQRRSLSGWMVARNAVVASAMLVLFADSDARALTWTDALTISAGVCVMSCLYVAVEGMFGKALALSRGTVS